MNPDTPRCIHDMVKGQCGICDDRRLTKQGYRKRIKPNIIVEKINPDGDPYRADNLKLVPMAKVKLKHRMNGRSSKRKG